MTPEYLAATAGILLSLLFAYIPGFATWFQGQSPDIKRILMLLFLLAVAAGSVAYVCSGLGGIEGVTCDQAGFIAVAKVWIAAIIANQATYALMPKVGANK